MVILQTWNKLGDIQEIIWFISEKKIGSFLENGGELKDAYYVDQTFSHLHTFDELATRNAGRVYEEMEFE